MNVSFGPLITGGLIFIVFVGCVFLLFFHAHRGHQSKEVNT